MVATTERPSEGHESEAQIRCIFTTRLGQQYRVPETTLAVPAHLTRYGLSQVVNHLLALDPPVPFDFLVKGKLVQQSLEKFLLANGISAEQVLEVEYGFAVTPPQLQDQFPHTDWVSAVAASSPEDLFSGAYDGLLRRWASGGAECIQSTLLHKGAVTALACPSPSTVVSGGKDGRVCLSEVGSSGQPGAGARVLVSYEGHTASVEAVGVDPAGGVQASAGWDGRILLWRAGAAVAEAAREGQGEDAGAVPPAAKKRQRAEGGRGVAADEPAPAHVEAPRGELQGHARCVAALAWGPGGREQLFSGGWDHTVRQWDLEAGAAVSSHAARVAVYAVCCPQGAASLLVFGGAERGLHAWDPRAPDHTVRALAASHTGWVSALAAHPTSPHHVLSASHDATAKLWDLRASVPLHTLRGHSDKVLCCGWAGPALALTGGADCTLRAQTVII